MSVDMLQNIALLCLSVAVLLHVLTHMRGK